MQPVRRKLFKNAIRAVDLLVMMVAFLLTVWVVHFPSDIISLEDFLSMRIKIQNFVIFFCMLLSWHWIFSFFRLYHTRRFAKWYQETFDIVKATALGSGVIALLAYLFEVQIITLELTLIFWFTTSGVISCCRLLMRMMLQKARRRGRNRRNMLVIGTNNRVLEFVTKIENSPELGYRIIGFGDDDWSGARRVRNEGYRIVTDYQNLRSFLRTNVIDEVVISLPLNSYYRLASQIAAMCAEQGIVVRFLSDIFRSNFVRSSTEYFENVPLTTYLTGAMDGWQVDIKRILDFSIAAILLVLLLPLFLVISLLIKVISPGPVFFLQERIGFNKRTFKLWKFRTMVVDAERRYAEVEMFNEVSGPVFKIKEDPRVTSIGRLLRKMSIDELPQLINVLKGEISLVGPRPLPVRDYKGFQQDWHRRRFSVRPGITCLWQVNGRNSIPFDKWMELDMYYIDNWSLWLDFKIMLKTVPAVLRGLGAS